MNQLYRQIRKTDRNVYPVVMDFRFPTPARGVANRGFAPATERLRSEMVMCLAAVHHLGIHAGLSFDLIAEGLRSFTSRWVLVEFVPPEDETAKEYLAGTPRPWYTEPEFMAALQRRFETVERLPSYESPRTLILCRQR
jgi:hypothetical protein